MCIRDRPHLADLERRLSEEGRFEEFKKKFEEEYGDPWESSRQEDVYKRQTILRELRRTVPGCFAKMQYRWMQRKIGRAHV